MSTKPLCSEDPVDVERASTSASAALCTRGVLRCSLDRDTGSMSDLRQALVTAPVSDAPIMDETPSDARNSATSELNPLRSRRSSRAIPLQSGERLIDYETTFRAMINRRLLRQYHGTHKPSRMAFAAWTFAFLSIIAGFGTVSYRGTLAVRINLSTGFFGILVPLLLLYIALRVVMVVRWCLFWLALGTVTLLLMDDGNVCPLYSQKSILCLACLANAVVYGNLAQVPDLAPAGMLSQMSQGEPGLFLSSMASLCVLVTMVTLQVCQHRQRVPLWRSPRTAPFLLSCGASSELNTAGTCLLQVITIFAWLLVRRCYPLAVQRSMLCRNAP